MSSDQMEAGSESSSTGTEGERVLQTVGWSSFGFAVLQNICAAVLAVNGIRIAIGLGSLATASGALPVLIRFHADVIRIPMMGVALVGAVVNLAALWQIRRLRERPSAQWRRVALTAKQRRSESLQFALSIVTLLLLGFEYFLHRSLHG